MWVAGCIESQHDSSSLTPAKRFTNSTRFSNYGYLHQRWQCKPPLQFLNILVIIDKRMQHHACICTHMYMYVSVCICTYMYMHVYVCLCMYMYVFVRICTCMYVYVYMHLAWFRVHAHICCAFGGRGRGVRGGAFISSWYILYPTPFWKFIKPYITCIQLGLPPTPPPQRPHTKWARGVVQQIRHTSWLVTYEADRGAPSAALFQNSASSGVWWLC